MSGSKAYQANLYAMKILSWLDGRIVQDNTHINISV